MNKTNRISIIFFLIFFCIALDNNSVAQNVTKSDTTEIVTKKYVKSVHKFWKWFKKHEDKLSKPFTYPESQIDLLNKLSEVKNGIEYSLDINASKYAITITCNGNKALIPFVNYLVENAPKFEYWNVIAFKQISTIPDSLFFDDVVVFAKDLKIYLVNDHKKVHLNVFLKDYMVEDPKKIFMINEFITKAIGEYTIMTVVGDVKLQLYENYRVYMQTVRIFELKEAIDNEKRMFYSN